MLQIKEIWTTDEGILGASDWYEPFTDNIKSLFRSLMREYGHCVSKIYMDGPDNVAYPVGWVFEKKKEYADANRSNLKGADRYYKQETWVSIRQSL